MMRGKGQAVFLQSCPFLLHTPPPGTMSMSHGIKGQYRYDHYDCYDRTPNQKVIIVKRGFPLHLVEKIMTD